MTVKDVLRQGTCWSVWPVVLLLAPPAALATVDLHLIALTPIANVGETVHVQVVIASATEENAPVAAVQMIFSWDVAKLRLLGHTQDGAVNLLYSGFPADPYGINESSPPQDGLGFYQAWSPLGNPVAASPQGTLLTTLLFETLEPASATAINIVPSAGAPLGHTIVFDGTTPNTNITGELNGAAITIVAPCPGDLTGDGAVGVPDLLVLLASWGECPPPPPEGGVCAADLDASGSVGISDLLLLLSAWGGCS